MPPMVAAARPALPQQPTDYFSFMRAPRWEAWRPIIGVLVAGIAFLLVSTLAVGVGFAIDLASGRTTPDQLMDDLSRGEISMTPAVFLGNNVGLALLIPISMLLYWAFTGQRPKWLSSVVGGLRWKWLLMVAAALLPIWVIALGLELIGSWRDLTLGPDTVVLIIGILLTQPFQAAGEEYFFRGFAGRAVGSFFRNPRLALVFGALVPTVAFMFAHGAGDIWLNVFYVSFGLAAAWMTWRTGGLEAAIAMHVINNLASSATMPFSDISDVMNRGAGTVQPVEVLPVLITLALGVAVVEVMARKFTPARLGQDPATRAQQSTALPAETSSNPS